VCSRACALAGSARRAGSQGQRPHNRVVPSTALTDPWTLGSLRVPNRVMLAPLAGIGNWFVRLQAKRYGAGMAVSEMVSSHAIHYRNERTCVEMLRIDPREREPAPPLAGGPVSIQLFGEDPAIMRAAAAHVAAHTEADAIDINMGCPVPKVRRTGAGVGMLANPDLAVAITRAACEGAAEGLAARAGEGARAREVEGEGEVEGGDESEGLGAGAGVGHPLPVTVKLRSGLAPGDASGYELAHRLVVEAGAAAIGFHPRSAAVHHRGAPDYELAARLVATLGAPVILTGGLHDAHSTLAAYEQTGAAAVMLARGALGNPWLFEQLLGARDPDSSPTRAEVLDELDWTISRAVEHLGEPRATRYLRKHYPWYVARLGLDPAVAKRLNEALLRADTLAGVRGLLETHAPRYTGPLATPSASAVPA
jgi:tRNA-dihydrouridine synthase B